MDNYQYIFNCKQYVLTKNGLCVGPVLDEVSLCFSSRIDGFLMKHGSPAKTQLWFDKQKSSFSCSRSLDEADRPILITGRFPLDELNKLINNTSYSSAFLEKIEKGLMRPEPIF